MFGNYYVYDSVAPLADILRTQLGFSSTQIGTLNAIYSLPNIVMVLIGGVLVDRFGARNATFGFTAVCLVGALLPALSGSFAVMALGRLIFGLGAESMIVAVTAALGHWIDTGVLLAAVVVNALIGFLQEGKAESAMHAIRSLLSAHAQVVRDGRRREIDATELVPGDVVVLASGDRVPADLRLLATQELRIDESALTG
jgi:magnesium-transporting ATPase (P-type)